MKQGKKVDAMNGRKRVVVGMSGGVDSSVAALLLLRRGYEVEGATFRLKGAELPGTGAGDGDMEDARRVCKALGIPHHAVDFRTVFRERVVDYFVAEYRRGATPNPCVACNRAVKFGAFLPWALVRGFDRVATGHYANVEWDEKAGRHRLRQGDWAPKDQSYVLYTLTQEQLARVLMPLGPYRKEEVRAMAEEAGLPVSRKAESQDICFVPDGDYGGFLEAYTGESPPGGLFVDENGKPLGKHRGIWHYTVGQRKGLGISLGRPVYVSSVDASGNTVTLADNASLFHTELAARDLCLTGTERPEGPFRCMAKIRYAAKPAWAEVTPLPGGGVRVVFDEPQRAPAPGQAVVFYDGPYVLGGATICG